MKSITVSGVGLKDTVEKALKDGGVQDDQKVKSMCRYILQSKSDGTVKKYYSYFNKWKLFCDKNGYDVMPAQPIHIALFLTELLDKCITYSVISSIVYSIKWVHRINGENDPTENGFVTNLLESAKRLRSSKVTKKDVVTTDMLIELCSSNATKNSEDLLQVRDLAMILNLFWLFKI